MFDLGVRNMLYGGLIYEFIINEFMIYEKGLVMVSLKNKRLDENKVVSPKPCEVRGHFCFSLPARASWDKIHIQ